MVPTPAVDVSSPPRLVNINHQLRLGVAGDDEQLTKTLTESFTASSSPSKSIKADDETNAAVPSTPMTAGNVSSSSDSASSSDSVHAETPEEETVEGDDASSSPYADDSTNVSSPYADPVTKDDGGKSMAVTVTVLSLHGMVAKQKRKKDKTKLGIKRNNLVYKGNAGGVSDKEEVASIVASFSQIISNDKVFLTHVPSQPVSLTSSAASSNDHCVSTSSAASVSSGSSSVKGGNISNPVNSGKGFGSKDPAFKPVVHWPSMSAGDDAVVGAALSTLQFKRSFHREKGDDKRYVPQTCPINLSISRNGKLVPLGKVSLIINGEERGESSLTVPIVSSISHSLASGMTSNAIASTVNRMNKAKEAGKQVNKKQMVTKLKMAVGRRKGKQDKSDSQGSSMESTLDNKIDDTKNVPMIKIKGDVFQFGLEEEAMLRVLVHVHDPDTEVMENEEKEYGDEGSCIDTYSLNNVCSNREDECNIDDDDSFSDNDSDCLSLEGEDSSILGQDDYMNSYIMEKNELRTLRAQLVQLEHTNSVLESELANTRRDAKASLELMERHQNTAEIFSSENAQLRTELEEQIMIQQGKTVQMEDLAKSLEQANRNCKLVLEAKRTEAEENERLRDKIEALTRQLVEKNSSQDDTDKEKEPSASTTITVDPSSEILHMLHEENVSLSAKLKASTANSESLLEELNKSKAEAEALPLFEKRVAELLAELNERDLEVKCLKDEIEELRVNYKEQLLVDASLGSPEQLIADSGVNLLLWDDDDGDVSNENSGDDPDEEKIDNEQNDMSPGGAGGWGVRRLGASLMSIEERMKERQKLFREQQQEKGIEKMPESQLPVIQEVKDCDNSEADEESANIVPTTESEEMSDGEVEEDAVKQAGIGAVSEGKEGASMLVVEESSERNTSPDADALDSTRPTPATLLSLQEAAAAGKGDTIVTALLDLPEPKSEAKNEAESIKNGGGGWGVRRLGSHILSVEERMKERQRAFREQQQRKLEQEEEKLKAEASAVAARQAKGATLMACDSNHSTQTSSSKYSVVKSDEQEPGEIELDASAASTRESCPKETEDDDEKEEEEEETAEDEVMIKPELDSQESCGKGEATAINNESLLTEKKEDNSDGREMAQDEVSGGMSNDIKKEKVKGGWGVRRLRSHIRNMEETMKERQRKFREQQQLGLEQTPVGHEVYASTAVSKATETSQQDESKMDIPACSDSQEQVSPQLLERDDAKSDETEDLQLKIVEESSNDVVEAVVSSIKTAEVNETKDEGPDNADIAAAAQEGAIKQQFLLESVTKLEEEMLSGILTLTAGSAALLFPNEGAVGMKKKMLAESFEESNMVDIKASASPDDVHIDNEKKKKVNSTEDESCDGFYDCDQF